ncbi:MAG TPA: hypothetical protein EYP85_02090 [Armatimonadetes bacterium]|nr:hypothetical protein [Armatimonadota bacterium]
MSVQTETFRLGIVPYLNAKPLTYALERGDFPQVETVTGVPAELAGALRAGELAAALVSSWMLFTDPNLVPVAGLGISARGPVQSVKLFSRVDFTQVRTVALDLSSLSSAALTKILLEKKWGLRPTYINCPPNLDRMLREADAALLIGDPGLTPHLRHVQTLVYDVLDLGKEWSEWTGLPFVFALWLAREKWLNTSLPAILQAAKERGLAALSEIAARESQRLQLPPEVCLHYLRQVINYDFGPREQAGLERFQELAREVGLLPS